MTRKTIDRIVWWIPFKKIRNAVRSILRKNNKLVPKKNGIFVHHFEMSITTKCTLRCVNCNNLNTHYYIPKYNTPPVDSDISSVIDDVNIFFSHVDFIDMFAIIGGEPFMHKDLYRLLEVAKANPKIGHITIVTNGTLIPKNKNLTRLKGDDRLVVRISDYGKLSVKKDEIKKTLVEEGINVKERDSISEKWMDAGEWSCRNRNTDELIDVYKSCRARNCKHMLNGKIYGCPRIAHSHNLGLYTPLENEYVDLREYKSNIKEKIYNFVVKGVKYYNACNYCDGTGKYSKIIDAALQLEKEVAYE